jgi:hypothetical protein
VDPNQKVVDWWDGEKKLSAAGTLEQVDCLRGQMMLHIRADGKLVRFRIPDPAKIVLAGGGEQNLACGVQKPARRIRIDYTPKKDAKSGAEGDIALIEFP